MKPDFCQQQEHLALLRAYAEVQRRCTAWMQQQQREQAGLRQQLAAQTARAEALQAEVQRLRALQAGPNAVKELPPLAAAERVICQTGCISHGAYWRVKAYCRRHGGPCRFGEHAPRAVGEQALSSLSDPAAAVPEPQPQDGAA